MEPEGSLQRFKCPPPLLSLSWASSILKTIDNSVQNTEDYRRVVNADHN